MKLTLRALAALLAYPSRELQDHVADIREAFDAEDALAPPARRRLESLLDALATRDLLDLQADYTELFDRARTLSLNLFEHVHGDSRERGQAMIDLRRQYAERGWLFAGTELPDFVPVFVEFASCLPPAEARETLAQPAHVFAALEQRLAQRGSPYAAIFAAVTGLSGARPDESALAELEARAPSDDAAKIDDEWEEAPVSFTRPANETSASRGIVAKIRWAGKAMGAAIKS